MKTRRQKARLSRTGYTGEMAFRAERNAGEISDFIWSYCDQAACNILNRSACELMGRRLLEIFPGSEEEGLFDMFIHVVEKGRPLHIEQEYHREGVDGRFEIYAEKLGDGFVVNFGEIKAGFLAKILAGRT